MKLFGSMNSKLEESFFLFSTLDIFYLGPYYRLYSQISLNDKGMKIELRDFLLKNGL